MIDRPILFSAPMVRALLDGSKTQTRRVVKGWENWPKDTHHVTILTTRGTALAVDNHRCTHGPEIKCRYGLPGDRLWVRETWLQTNPFTDGGMHTYGYRASDEIEFPDAVWKPSIHMPRTASRITLEVTGVRVERLQDISEADAQAEGIRETAPPLRDFRLPWVWVVEFKMVKP